MSKAQKSPSRRQDLLDAALSCFGRHGYAATTIEMIRAEAKSSIGSLYHHFDGKESLAAALYLDRLSRYQSRYLEILMSASDAEAGVRGIVAHHLRWAERHPQDARFLLDHAHLERSLAKSGDLPKINRRFYRGVQEWLDHHVDSGSIQPLSADLYHALWLGPAQELARQWLAGRSRTRPTDVVEIISDTAWAALATSGSTTLFSHES